MTKSCYNCDWRGDGEEVCDDDYCWLHGKSIGPYPEFSSCELWKKREEGNI